MFPPFDQELAHHYCLELVSKLDSGQAFLQQLTPQSVERQGQGLMVGTLVCTDKSGNRVVLAAVSGISRQLVFENPSEKAFIVVPPVVSEREINAALKKNDEKIHDLTRQINELTEAARLQTDVTVQTDAPQLQTEASRLQTAVTPLQTEASRLQTAAPSQTNPNATLSSLTAQRSALCDESLLNVFSLYNFTRFDGTKITLNQIIKEHGGALPPTGTGDCCAPKLLSYAFENGLIPLSMDEVYYGRDTKNKKNGSSYPPCDERCGYILPFILGLEVIYRDSQIVVVNKPAGLLSVPGRGPEKQDCIVNRVKKIYPFLCSIDQPSVHRLDMETSGLLVLAFTKESHDNLSLQFEKGTNSAALQTDVSPQTPAAALQTAATPQTPAATLQTAATPQTPAAALQTDVSLKTPAAALQTDVPLKTPAPHKKYLALLEGVLPPSLGNSGRLELPFRLDPNNRPHQIYDEKFGKIGITLWQKENVEYLRNPDGTKITVTRVTFIPKTGRTHQLRLASASSHGLNHPICGDSLYGNVQSAPRLMLQAFELFFNHPVSGERMEFTLPYAF